MNKFDSKNLQTHFREHKSAYLVLGLVLTLNVTVLIDLVRDWLNDDNYSHGLIIIPISIWLFFKARHEMVFPVKPDRLGAVIFGVGCFGLIMGVSAQEYFTTRFSLVLMITGFAYYYLGRTNFRRVWFSFAFLLFMIPIPSVIYYSATLPMQLLASKITTGLLSSMGVPIIRNGNILTLPNFSLEVAEACSGLRSLVALMALGALYAYHQMPGKVLPILLFVAAIPIAIATNIFRVFITAIGGYVVSPELAKGFLHELSGMFVFGGAMVLTIIFGVILTWTQKLLSRSSR